MNKFNSPKVSTFNRMTSVLFQRYERYLPTAFDESLSLLEKMNKIIEFLNSVVEHINNQSDELEKWEKELLEELNITLTEYETELENVKNQYEDFREYIINDLLPDSLVNKLEEWLLNGTLEEIITDTLIQGIRERLGIDISVIDYGAVGDGETNDTQAFKDTLSYLESIGGGKMVVPSGEYLIGDVLEVPDNVTVEGSGKSTVIKPYGNYSSILFRADGSFSDTNAIVQNAGLGSHFVDVQNSNQFSVGDYIRVMSQRCATEVEDTGAKWVLGHATSSSDTVYFGEYKRISAIIGTELYFRGGLQYPDFLTHNNNETSEKARNNSTVDKINYVENVVMKDFVVSGRFSQVMRFEICKNFVVDNVQWLNASDGRLVSFWQSFMCEARNCEIDYRLDETASSVYARNGFASVSSLMCGFDNVIVSNGTQCVDFSYKGGVPSIPDHDSYLKNSRIYGGTFAGMTAHGCTVNPQITNNQMTNCRQDGIVVRSRNALITNNTIIGSPLVDVGGYSYGIAFSQAGAQDGVANGNIVKGFSVGLSVFDSTDSPLMYSGARFYNNTVSLANRGCMVRRNSPPVSVRSEIMFANNTFKDFTGVSGRGADIYPYIRDVTFSGNTFVGNTNISGGIFSRGNSYEIYMYANKFTDVGRVVWFLDVDDDVVFPGGSKFFIFDSNNRSNTVIDFEHSGNLQNRFITQYSGLRPYQDGVHALGFSNQRWSQVFALTGTIVTSDRDSKENIEKSYLGLDVVENLNPVKFKYKKGERTHYGLIAQEVEEVINQKGIETSDFGAITKDENGYGMRYDELIPILIKAIQELNDKIK